MILDECQLYHPGNRGSIFLLGPYCTMNKKMEQLESCMGNGSKQKNCISGAAWQVPKFFLPRPSDRPDVHIYRFNPFFLGQKPILGGGIPRVLAKLMYIPC